MNDRNGGIEFTTSLKELELLLKTVNATVVSESVFSSVPPQFH